MVDKNKWSYWYNWRLVFNIISGVFDIIGVMIYNIICNLRFEIYGIIYGIIVSCHDLWHKATASSSSFLQFEILTFVS